MARMYICIYVHTVCILCTVDNNEVEIVRVQGLPPLIQGTALAAEGLTSDLSAKTDKEVLQLEELATQCCRALRNLSVNRKFHQNIECLVIA